MRKTILIGILVLLPAALVAGGSLVSCTDVTCGTGTHEAGGKCVASLPNTCGPGTYSWDGQCIPVEGSHCGPNTKWDNDAGLCVGVGGGTGDGGTPTLTRGARWNKFELLKPESIAPLANIQLPGYFADGTIVVILRSEEIEGDATAVNLHGGDGLKTSDDPLTYTFVEGFRPPSVLTYLDEAVTGSDGKSYRPFHTSAEFDWTFKFLPGQPALYMYKASVTGTLDPDGIPVASEPSPGMQGTFKGCFTPYGDQGAGQDCVDKCGAENVYLEVLTQNMLQLIQGSGGQLDADCTGSGSLNGYLLEAKWESTELMDLTAPAAPTDGGV